MLDPQEALYSWDQEMNGRQLVEWVIHEASVPSIEEVCKMEGRSRGECWGCPITSCKRQITPFEVAVVDEEVIAKAIQKLKSNQIWIGGASGKTVYRWLANDGAGELSDSTASNSLVSLLAESRDKFLLNQAVESAKVGNQTVEQAAASVHFLSKDNNNPKSFRRFKEMVDADRSDE